MCECEWVCAYACGRVRVSGRSWVTQAKAGEVVSACALCACQKHSNQTQAMHRGSNRNKSPIPMQRFAVRWPRRSDTTLPAVCDVLAHAPCLFLLRFHPLPVGQPGAFLASFW